MSPDRVSEYSCRHCDRQEKKPPTILRISELRKLLTLAKDGFKVEAQGRGKGGLAEEVRRDFNSHSADGHGANYHGRLLRRRAS